MIGILDYRAGNAPSVLNAMEKLHIPARLISSPQEVMACNGIILPGVGSAKATMDSLQELGVLPALCRKVLEQGTHFMGICVGLQVLFEHSDEGDVDCLGWLKGKVHRFCDQKVRVPQIGWNEVRFVKESLLVEGLAQGGHFYFVNSYYVQPANDEIALGKTQYGGEFTSMVSYQNIHASQFHLEKSGVLGLTILRNFADLAKRSTTC